MSDSDSDFLSPNNVLSFTNNTSSIGRIKGPNFESNFNLNFNGNSSIRPTNFERQRVNKYEQRSILGHREMSPTMSIRSVEPHSFQRSFCHGGFAQSSIINGRGGRCTSPALSTSSNMSTAASIISAFKSGQFNNHELQSIKNALNKCFKGRVRKKISKRRNLKLYMKGARRKSGDDSGDLGSDSSVSSNDCKSTRTGITMHSNYSQYMNSSRQYKGSQTSRVCDDAKSSKTERTNLRKTMKDSIMFKDCTESLKQNSYRNILSLGPKNCNDTLNNRSQNTNLNTTCQKERFKSNFLLPSQRFAKSTVPPIPEEQCITSNLIKTVPAKQNIPHVDGKNSTETDDETIFFEISDPETSILKQPASNKKRCLNSSDESPSYKIKKTKLSNPKKLIQANEINSATTNQQKDEDLFVKPMLPLPKSTKSKVYEKPSVTEPVESRPLSKMYVSITHSTLNNNTEDDLSIEDQESKTMLSDVSSRPSFMKRKLFTQTLDVTEHKGNSNDSSPGISPQKDYEDIAKEKNKARKLVTNQSYLSRDVQREDNQLLDLIHKIVPREHMNVTTNTTQKIDIHPQKKNKNVKTNTNISPIVEDRWNITNIISTCNNDDVSDTYTDEEIFNLDNRKSKEKKPFNNKNETNTNDNSKQCIVVVTKIDSIKNVDKFKTPIKVNKKKNVKNNRNVIDLAQAFWNMDSESETPDKQKQQNAIKLNNSGNSFAKKRQDHYAGADNLRKNTKSVLDTTESTVNSLSLNTLPENVQIKSNKSVRVCVEKVVKDKKIIPSKTCKQNRLAKNSNTIDSPTVAKVNKDKNPGDKSEKSSNIKNKKCIKRNGLQHQDAAKGSAEMVNVCELPNTTITQKKNIESENVIHKTAKSNCILDVSNISPNLHNVTSSKRPRGRPRKTLSNTLVTPNISLDQDNLNCSKTLRSRTRKYGNMVSSKIVDIPDSSLNSSNRLRRCRTKETCTSLNSNNENTPKNDKKKNILETQKGVEKNTPTPPLAKIKTLTANTAVPLYGIESKLLNHKKKSLTVVKKVTPSKVKKYIEQQVNKNGNNYLSQRTRRSSATKTPVLKTALNNSIITRSLTKRNKTASTPTKPSSAKTKKIHNCRKVLKNANKENIVNKKNIRSTRTVNNSSLCNCSETNTPVKSNNKNKDLKTDELNQVKRSNLPKKRDTKIDQFLLPTAPKARDMPESPKPLINSFCSDRLEAKSRTMLGGTKDRILEKSVVGNVKVWGLGFARPTIGVVPPHGATEKPRYNATIIDDDTKSITVRSVTSLPTRTRRPQFLHVF